MLSSTAHLGNGPGLPAGGVQVILQFVNAGLETGHGVGPDTGEVLVGLQGRQGQEVFVGPLEAYPVQVQDQADELTVAYWAR
jgi:hypothetical protein